MKFYIIADTHINHDKIIAFCERPTNYEERIFRNLKNISGKDCLIHLGDIVLGEDAEAHEKYIIPLKCRKILVLGNHDSKSYSWYMEHGWDFACDVFRIKYAGKIVCLSHRPQLWDGEWEINIHGHLHNLDHRKDEFNHFKEWHKLYSPELENYRPVELSKLIQAK